MRSCGSCVGWESLCPWIGLGRVGGGGPCRFGRGGLRVPGSRVGLGRGLGLGLGGGSGGLGSLGGLGCLRSLGVLGCRLKSLGILVAPAGWGGGFGVLGGGGCGRRGS